MGRLFKGASKRRGRLIEALRYDHFLCNSSIVSDVRKIPAHWGGVRELFGYDSVVRGISEIPPWERWVAPLLILFNLLSNFKY